MLRVFRRIFGIRQTPQPVQKTEDPSSVRRARLEQDLKEYRYLLNYASTLRANSLTMPQRMFPYVPSSNPLIRPVREPKTSWQY